jgi:hypothetical protein
MLVFHFLFKKTNNFDIRGVWNDYKINAATCLGSRLPSSGGTPKSLLI